MSIFILAFGFILSKQQLDNISPLEKVFTDENVKEDVQNHLNEDNIHIRVTKLTYPNILKEGYLVNLILGGIIFLPSIISIIINICALKKYKNSQAKLIDEDFEQYH